MPNQPWPVCVQALVAWVAASGEPLGAADRAALAELVQRAAAARGAVLPGADQARTRGCTGQIKSLVAARRRACALPFCPGHMQDARQHV